MKIDAWTHILTPTYVHRLEAVGGEAPGASLLVAGRGLHDLNYRFEVMGAYEEYRQVLTPLPGPTLQLLTSNNWRIRMMKRLSGKTRRMSPDQMMSIYRQVPDVLKARQYRANQTQVDQIRRSNEEMAELVRQHPDRFVGFAAATPIADPDAATQEAIRAVRELGALGVQLEADAAAFPLHEERYDALFAAMEEMGACVWLHPFRTPASPGSPQEAAPYLLWQVFGWVFDTTITVSRLIMAGIYDRHPQLKLIVHHGGALIPHFSGRLDMLSSAAAMDPALGKAMERLQQSPMDYCKMLYVDTAMFGSRHSVACVVDFFGPDHVLFGTDTPFDGRGGSYLIPSTISDVEEAVGDENVRAAIFEGNARRILGIRPSPELTREAHATPLRVTH